MTVDDEMEFYYLLMAAIISQAVHDWAKAKEEDLTLEMGEFHDKALRECEKFFLSDWCNRITGLEGEDILKILSSRYDNGEL